MAKLVKFPSGENFYVYGTRCMSHYLHHSGPIPQFEPEVSCITHGPLFVTPWLLVYMYV